MAEGRRNSEVDPGDRDHGIREGGGDKEKFLEGGYDAYISKPISIPNFLQTVEHFANRVVAEREPTPAQCEKIAAQSEN